MIHNGFPLAGRRGAGGDAISKPHGRFVILSVGRLAVEKGHRFLLDAVARVAKTHGNIEVWLAGVGPLEADLRAQAARLGIAERVRFLGFQEDVTALHAAADLFIFPSLSEGFGNALVEALVAGLPVVASDLPAIRHDVLGGEPAAARSPPGTCRHWPRRSIGWCRIPTERAVLGTRAMTVGARFHVDRMCDAYRALYARVAHGPVARAEACTSAAAAGCP